MLHKVCVFNNEILSKVEGCACDKLHASSATKLHLNYTELWWELLHAAFDAVTLFLFFLSFSTEYLPIASLSIWIQKSLIQSVSVLSIEILLEMHIHIYTIATCLNTVNDRIVSCEQYKRLWFLTAMHGYACLLAWLCWPLVAANSVKTLCKCIGMSCQQTH